FILALSHDEVVHGKGSLIGKQPGYYPDKFGGLMTYLGYMMAHPGKKLLFMGAEIGQFSEWNENRGLDWFLLDQYPTHRGLNKFVSDLNRIYLEEKALWEQDCSWDGFQWLAVNESNWNILSWRRIAKDGSSIVALMNFSPMYREGYLLGVPEAGEYKTILNSAASCYGVGNSLEPGSYHTEDGEINGFAQHIKLNVAPNSVVYLKKE
ncbi:MAG: alpha amylase C-terminal domain-containing protein, partial [Clostridia bacterium]|nr:alpha amylase C-terminal domain-containing protein [Clostridia bacterium]